MILFYLLSKSGVAIDVINVGDGVELIIAYEHLTKSLKVISCDWKSVQINELRPLTHDAISVITQLSGVCRSEQCSLNIPSFLHNKRIQMSYCGVVVMQCLN